MNQIVNPQPMQLPTYLQALAKFNSGAAVMGGITIGGAASHQIGIKGSRWRIQDPQGGETVVPQHYLDVIIVDANPNLSKVFYLGSYNPADTEFKAPDCYSDNGVAPSARASKPQSSSCATCPHNVWGSKVTPSGSQTKSCSDSKKLAVILADNPAGPVYLLKIPAASLKNIYNFVESVTQRGIPLAGIVVRLQFDPSADYPKIILEATGWATEAQVAAVTKVIDTEEVKTVIGLNDKPAAVASTAGALIPAATSTVTALPPITTPAPDPFAGLNAGTSTPAAKRTRKPKAEAAPVAAAPIPTNDFFTAPQPGHTTPVRAGDPMADVPNAFLAAQAVTVTPQPTSSALDDLISQALKV